MVFAREFPATAAFASYSSSDRDRSATRPCSRERTSNVVRFISIDDSTISSLNPTFAESTSPATLPPSGITPIQEFEPVLNAEAAASFVIIGIVFTLLQLRINAVSDAARRRSTALQALRRTESLLLSSSDVGVDASDRPMEEQLLRAKNEYARALREEMDLRTIAPGVRIVAPNDPKKDEEERAAAKRYLGWDNDEFGDGFEGEAENNNTGLGGSNGGIQSNKSEAGMSNSANIILLGVASTLIVLLWTLSFDPMVADQVFTTLGGSPPEGMPLTSW